MANRVALLGRPGRRARPLRRVVRRGAGRAEAASRARERGARLADLHEPLRRVPPGRRRGRIRHGGAGAGARPLDGDAGGRGGPDRPLLDAALRHRRDLEPRPRLADRLRRVGEAPGRPGGVGDRPHRTGAGGPRRLAARRIGPRGHVPRHRPARCGMKRWLLALLALLLGRGRRAPRVEREERILPDAPTSPRAELVVLALFGLTALSATAFIVVYALDRLSHQTQLLGLTLGLAFAFLAAALIVIANRLVVTEELEEDYPPAAHPAEQEAIDQLAEESTDRMTRKRLLVLGGGAAGAAIGAALVTPAASLGPILAVAPLLRTPWREGARLVDERGRPLLAHEIHREAFYTAFPEGA